MQQKNVSDAATIAQWRFSLVAPVLNGTFTEPSRAAYYRRVTGEKLAMPDGTAVSYSPKTLEKWVSMYQRYGLDGLLPHQRSDKGVSRVLSDEAISEIHRLKEQFPRLNATQIHSSLVANSFIPGTASVDCVQRFIKHNNLNSAENPSIRDRKAFEESAFGRMWQADTCYFPQIMEDGRSRKVFCIMIIDDHSRLLVGGGLFEHDSAANFQKVLKEAIATYGIPRKLYVDNGAPYSNEQLSMICTAVGIVLLHTRVRDGASKAKIERHWRTMKERWLYKLDLNSIKSMEQFNSMMKDYMRDYNTAFHSGINAVPYDRFTATRDGIRVPESRQWLDECFLNRTKRKVRKDATISIDKKSYDVPMQFISCTVDIRYEPGTMDTAFILSDKKKYPIRLTNKVENCRTKRNNLPPIDYSKTGGSEK